MNPRFLIYGLVDVRPDRVGELRYVGQSSVGIGRASVLHSDKCLSWQKSVRNMGLREEYFILETWDGEGDPWDFLNDQEIFYVSYFRFVGADLTNLTDGGGGAPGHAPWNKGKKSCYAPEVIQAMRKAKLGKPLSKRHRENLSRKRIQKGTPHLEKKVRCQNDGEEFRSIKDAAYYYDIFYSAVRRQLKGKIQRAMTTKNLSFEYIN